MRSIQRNLDAFYQAGIRPVAISVDTPEESQRLMQQAGYSFPLLSDQKRETIARYDLVHKSGGADGGDIARPAEFLIDAAGTVRWRDLTKSYLKRVTPEQMLEAARALQ